MLAALRRAAVICPVIFLLSCAVLCFACQDGKEAANDSESDWEPEAVKLQASIFKEMKAAKKLHGASG